MRISTISVTPKVAEYMLRNNKNNRNVSKWRVALYAEEMKRGAWKLNGETISINKNGELLNGQHRLLAVIKSGCTVEMAVAFDVDNDVHLFDRGRTRSVTDQMKMDGVSCNNYTAAMARLFIYLEDGNNKISDSRIHEFHEKYADDIKFIVKVCKRGKVINEMASHISTAVLNARLAGVPDETLERFCGVLQDGFYKDNTELAAVVLRNDIIAGTVATGNEKARAASCCMVENAIADFVKGYPRKRTYKKSTNRVYGGKEKA